MTITTGAAVQKVLFEGSASDVVATGVEVSIDDQTSTVKANKEVILAAGVFHTPKLLELSGIGSKDLLARHGIPVVINNANVGENMQNHLMSIVPVPLSDGVDVAPGIQALAFVPLPE